MKEITSRELMEALSGKVVKIESVDVYGVSVSMSRATVSYDDLCNRIIFTCGDSSVAYEMNECFESITYDESDGSYTIQFKQYMTDIIITNA